MGSYFCLPSTRSLEGVSINHECIETTTIPIPVHRVASNKTTTNFDDLSIDICVPNHASCKDHFVGIKDGCTLYCRDQYRSQFNQDIMYKWREATVNYLSDDGDILIHFLGWNTKFDIRLNLNTDTDRLCPEGILSDEEIKRGIPLSDAQYAAASTYFLIGAFPQDFDDESSSHDRGPNLGKTQLYTTLPTLSQPNMKVSAPEEQPPPLPVYSVGQQVDILDYFPSKRHPGTELGKWRKGRIKSLSATEVRVQYDGWADEWDDTIDVSEVRERFAPFGTHTYQTTVAFTAERNRFPLSLDDARHARHAPGTKRDENSFRSNLPQLSASGRSRVASKKRDHPDSNSYASHQNQPPSKTRATSVQYNGVLPQRDHAYSHAYAIPISSRDSFSSDGGGGGSKYDQRIFSPSSRPINSTKSYEVINENDTLRDDAFGGMDEMEVEEMLKAEKIFEDKLYERGMHIFKVAGDGNCLFRAVSHQLFGTDESHAELRALCVSHMQAYAKRFKLFCEDFDRHVESMSMLGTWGTEMEIRALEEINDMLICIYSSESSFGKLQPLNTNFDDFSLYDASITTAPPILLSYHGHNHYNSILNEKNPVPLKKRGEQQCLILQIREKSMCDEDVLAGERK